MERSDLPTRWLVLFLTSFMMMASYFCYDNPAALKDQIQTAMHLTDYQFNLFYTVYSMPNVILPLFGGLLIDRFGSQLSLITFMVCLLAGQGLFALGVSLRSFDTSLWGRVVFGLGGESIGVLQSTIVVEWFKGKEMALAMGWSLTLARLGSVINDWACPEIYSHGFPFLNKHDPAAGLWLGFFITMIGFLAALVLIYVEIRTDEFLREKKVLAIQGAYVDATMPLLDSCAEEGQVHQSHVNDDTVTFASILDFKLSFWLLTFSCLIVYATVLPFNNVATSVIMWKAPVHSTVAARLMSIPYIISAIINPFLGGLVDVVGLRVYMLLNGSFALLGVHLAFAFVQLTTVLSISMPLAILGLAYSLYAAAMWPSVALVVDSSILGTAYGLITAIQNGGLATMPIIVGRIHDATKSYKAVELFFAYVAFVGVLAGVGLLIVDKANGSPLNKASGVAAEEEGVR